MPNSERFNQSVFETPGPGSWQQDPVHFPRPLSRYYQETQPAPFRNGTKDFAVYYGLLIDGLQISYVNGFAYIQTVPASEKEIPARFERSKQVFEQKLWREQLRAWDEVYKPASIANHRELQSINPDALSDSQLVSYLKRCRDHHANMIAQHLHFTAPALIPVGDFLAYAVEWTGLAHSELLDLMQGASTLSAGQSEAIDQLKFAFSHDQTARNILMSDSDPKEIFTKLRALKGDVGKAMNRYLDFIGNRLMDGFDITEPRAIEMPDSLIRAIRLTVEEDVRNKLDIDKLSAKIRSRVPAAQQRVFDELLGEARLVYRLRDERGIYSDIWAAGIMRRAALAAGYRVTSRGCISTPEQMLDATLDEMCSFITDSRGPSSDELAKRTQYRITHTAKEAPMLLGPPPPPPPDLTGLPPATARVMRAFFISMGEIFESAKEEVRGEDKLSGLAACKGVYEGPARCISSPAEFERIKEGDVLITASTSEAFNIILPLLGAIVTDNGGLLSHAAIIAREYGIPGVVGTREATKGISDGMRVRVDGDKGEVTVLK